MNPRMSLLAGFALLQACTLDPPYRPEAGVSTVPVKLDLAGDLTLCAQDRKFSLKPGEDGYAAVPAGQRITLLRDFVSGGYPVTYTCTAGISFVPETGQSYYASFELRNERCMLLVFREAPQTRVGISLEPTLGSRQACGAPAFPTEP